MFTAIRTNLLHPAILIDNLQLEQNGGVFGGIGQLLPGLRAEIPAVRHIKAKRVLPLTQEALYRIGLVIQDFFIYRMLRRKLPVIRTHVIDISPVDTVCGSVKSGRRNFSIQAEGFFKLHRWLQRPKGRTWDLRPKKRVLDPAGLPFLRMEDAGFKVSFAAGGIASLIPNGHLPCIFRFALQRQSLIGKKRLLGRVNNTAVPYGVKRGAHDQAIGTLHHIVFGA